MIIITGSLAFDFIMNFPGKFAEHIMPDKIHMINLSFLAEKLNKNFGGCAGNIAYGLSLLGRKTALLASAGKDFGEYKKFLEKNKVKTDYIKIYKNDFTANYFAVADKADNQIGGFYAGAMAKDGLLSLSKIKEKISFAVISPTFPLAMIQFARECKEQSIPYMFDPGMQLPRFSKNQLAEGILGSEILVGNDYEIVLSRKKLKISKKELLSKTKLLITTLGKEGSIIENKSEKIKIKAAMAKKISDPVGAGDAFRAGFLAGYIKGKDWKTCGQMGSISAVYTVEQYGTTTHRFTKKEFCDRYKKSFRKEIKL